MNAYNRKKKKLNWLGLPAVKLIFRLLMVLLLFSVSRWLIYLFNTEFFHHLTLGQAFHLFFVGMRFDLVVIAYVNMPMILLYCLPFKFIYNRVIQGITSFYYVFVNSVVIILNMVDVIYFRFIGRRMTSELFQFFSHPEGNDWTILGQVVVNYWYIIVMMVLFVFVLVVVSKGTRLAVEQSEDDSRWAFVQWISLMVFAVLTPIAARGGLQEKPVDTSTASRYADSQNEPIVLNTPFMMVKSPTHQELEERHYDGLEEVDFSPVHFSTVANRFVGDSLTFRPNLMYIVMEGIGQEMTGFYNPDRRYPVTPFLDALLERSLTFNGRANGRRPIEALPSLLSGIPSLMDVDFVSSIYNDNRFDGLEKSLQQQGYVTAMLQYDNIVILDRAMDSLEQPFATVIFIPSSRRSRDLNIGFELPEESYLWSGFEKSVYYADCALRDFFSQVEREPWFDSTLFVITADHANTEHYLPEYSNIWGMYSIPIAFYMPSRIEALRSEELAQQVDLNLSILSALGINDTVFSFGRNVFDSLTQPYFIAYINQTYQFSDGRYLVQSDGDNTIGVFNIQQDRQLNDNLIDRIQCDDLADIMKKIIQEYNHRVINNQLFIDKEALHEQVKDTVYLEPGGGELQEE